MSNNDPRSVGFRGMFLQTAFLLVTLFLCGQSRGNDWPQWRGPLRDGVWHESGVRSDMPTGELPVRWRVPAALGYAGPAVASGKVFLFEYEKRTGEIKNNPGSRAKLEGLERLRCLNVETGKELWRHEYERQYNVSYPSGPRCTPTVNGERVYILGAEGDLKCLQIADGRVVWEKSFHKDFGAETPIWGHSAHPLVDDDHVYCLVGGEGSIVVAFDKRTGAEKWRALSAYEPGYSPPSMIRVGGQTQLVIFHPKAVSGLAPASGEVLWSVPIEPSYGMSIAQPLLAGNRLFVSGYNKSVCFTLPVGDGAPEVLWSGTPKTSVSSANASPIFDGKVIYGIDANDSALVAVDPATGKRYWQTKVPTVGKGGRGRHGTTFVVRQGETNRYWLFSEQGELILAQLDAAGYEELGRQQILKPSGEAFGRAVVWSHPAFADRAVFARNDEEIVCVDLSAE